MASDESPDELRTMSAADDVDAASRANAVTPPSSLPLTGPSIAQANFSATTQDDSSIPVAYPRVEGYRITGKLGEGGMGTVWQAIQLSTRREVALKLMSERVFASRHAALRFQREVELAAKLDHPNIAVIYEAGMQKGVYSYAMRLVRGCPLDQYIQREKLSHRAILALMQIVCDAVGHAHEMGILHRDLKPSNVMVDEKGRPFVLDFGLAKALGEAEADVSTTHEGDVVGTPAYMSPEQAQGRIQDVDTRTDVYALGVMLYMLLTGRHPVDLTGSRFEVLTRIVQEKIKPLREVSGDVDPKLEMLVMKALSKDRAKRYADGSELAEAIKVYLSQATSAGSAVPVHARKNGRLAAIAAVALVTVVIAILVWPDNDEPPQTSPSNKQLPATLMDSTEVYVPTSGAIDLLALVTPNEDAVHGDWSRVGSSLRGQSKQVVDHQGRNVNLEIPIELAGNYELKVGYMRRGGPSGPVRVVLPVADRLVALEMGGYIEQGGLSGLELIDGKQLPRNSTTHKGFLFKQDQQYLLNIVVTTNAREASIRAVQDGITFVDWKGRIDSLTLHHWNEGLRPGSIALGTFNAALDFDLAELRMISGTAKRLRPKPTSQHLASVWPLGPAEDVVPGLIPRPASLPNAKRWNLVTRRPLAFRQNDSHLAFDRNGTRLVLAPVWEPIRVYELLSMRLAYVLPGQVGKIACSPDGQRIAASVALLLSAEVEVWDLPQRKRIRSFKAHDTAVHRMAWSQDSTLLASGGFDGRIRVWRADGIKINEIVIDSPVCSLTWGPGNLLAGGSNDDLNVYSFNSNVPVVTLDSPASYHLLTWSPDGNWLAASGWGDESNLERTKITIWDAKTGKEHATLEGNASFPNELAWSSDSSRLVSSGQDTWVRVFDVAERRQLKVLKLPKVDGQHRSVRDIAWSADGQWIAAMDDAGQVALWNGDSYAAGPVLKPVDQKVTEGKMPSLKSGDPVRIVIDAAASRIAEFSQAGQFIGPDATILDEFVYVVEEADGSYTTLEHAAFMRRIEGKATAAKAIDLTRGLVAHWPLDEDEGLTAKDVSGNNHHGTLQNMSANSAWIKDSLPPMPGDNKNGGALRFMEKVNRVDCSQLGTWGKKKWHTGTMAFWINTTMTQMCRPLASHGPDSNGFSFMLNWTFEGSASEPFRFKIHTGSNSSDGRDWFQFAKPGQLFSITDGKWHHLVVSWDVINHKGMFFIDGVQKETQLYRKSPYTREDFPDLSDILILGGTHDAKMSFFNGLLDDIRIYDRMLSDEEIKALVSPPIDLTRGLVAHWDFDEGEGLTAKDSSGNEHHGTLKNMDPREAWVREDLPPKPFNQPNIAAIKFDGHDDLVITNTLGNWGSTRMPEGTIAYWIRTNSEKPIGVLSSWADVTGPEKGNGFGMNINTPGDEGPTVQGMRFHIRMGSEAKRDWISKAKQSLPINDGKWHHVVLRWSMSKGQCKMSLNGVTIADTQVWTNFMPGDVTADLQARVAIGSNVIHFLDGLLDDIRIYDRMLSDEEIKALTGVPTGHK